MIFLSIVNFFILLSILGYSFLLKNYFLPNLKSINNIDFLYGLSFLYLLGSIVHFIGPIKLFSTTINLIGIFIFFFAYFKKKTNLNLIIYFFIIFALSVLAYYSSDNVDGPMYHLQIINWLYEKKITFGLANLENRFGVNYPWHTIISINNFNFNTFSNKYFMDLVIFSFILYEIITSKKKTLSIIFISLCISYLFFFSLIHPFKFGVILNHFGNPSKDLFNMIIFFLTIYLFLKSKEKIEPSTYEEKNLLNLFFISITFCLMHMPVYFGIILLLFYLIYKNENFSIFQKINLYILIILIIWLSNSFILSGCFIYPVTLTCVETPWSIDKETVTFFSQETMRYSRSLPSLNLINNYHVVIETFKWFVPWFKDYYLTTSLHQINSLIYLIFFICIIQLNFKKKLIFNRIDFLLIFSVLIVNIFCLIAPEIRYAWGPHITLACLVTIILIKNYSLLNKIVNFFLKKITILTILFFLLFKFFPIPSYHDIFKFPDRRHNFTEKKLIGVYDGYEVFYNNWQCADLKEICVNVVKKKYKFKNKNSYLFVLK